LFVCHNHPAVLKGGVEMYLHDLYAAMSKSDEFEPLVLARAGTPFSPNDAPHPDSPIALVSSDPNQYLMYTDFSDFDSFWGRLSTSKEVLWRHFHAFLVAQQPDVVHFLHTVYMGYDMVRVARNALPDAAIVYSFHEYLPICHRDGQLLRTTGDVLCELESPRRCHECFPQVSPQDFYMRKRFIQSQLALVDEFLVPSEYVRDRYVDWGLPYGHVTVQPYLLEVAEPVPDETVSRPRNRFAYFGQLNPYKGADVLLEAMEIMGDDFEGHVWIYGANLDKQSDHFRRRFGEMVDAAGGSLTFAGPYERGKLNQLMHGVDWVLVPSIWWETGPITAMEALQYRRPVICSDIGGMAEKVTDGVNGLHFRRRDPEHLAEVMMRAAETPGLWEELQAGIPAEFPQWGAVEHLENLSRVYERALARHETFTGEALEQQANV
jgi:glycosyltransferase involved in cell wall biosynthesis